MNKALDIVVFGATGFTGRLVAEYFVKLSDAGHQFTWAMAGRDASKLLAVHTQIKASSSVNLITADVNNSEQILSLVRQAKLVLTTVGPYQLYGDTLVKACAQAGTDYVDLCGEPTWMAKMIPQIEDMAKASGARIVFSCGFDSIPFDLGVLFLQMTANSQLGQTCSRVSGRVKTMKGTFSGGTIASVLATVKSAIKDQGMLKLMKNPFALTPGFEGPKQASSHHLSYDETHQSWLAPFVMAPINIKNIHRSNYLLNFAWGKDFQYDEMIMMGDGEAGKARAKKAIQRDKIQNILLAIAPTRWILKTFVLPKPGEGPDLQAREHGSFEILYTGYTSDASITISVKGNKDPGYGSTSQMIGQSALCLVEDISLELVPGGVWTPASAMGISLIRRLEGSAGLSFSYTPE